MNPQLKAFADRAACSRLEWFGVEIMYNRTIAQQSVPVKALMSGVADKRKLKDGGFLYEHNAFCRIKFSEIPFEPLLGDVIIYKGGKPLQVAEVMPHPVNPEWRLGLSADI